MITILKQCEKELKDFPEEVREDLADALARLDEGLTFRCLYQDRCHL
ncbi:MAG: hypothetical protein HUU56_10850 [Bdellovibrionaceae bacterium]|nr:hypothetical protein [Pseudobdellovibrionaceae bacterium]